MEQGPRIYYSFSTHVSDRWTEDLPMKGKGARKYTDTYCTRYREIGHKKLFGEFFVQFTVCDSRVDQGGKRSLLNKTNADVIQQNAYYTANLINHFFIYTGRI